MQLTINNKHSQCRLLWTDSNTCLIARGMCFSCVDMQFSRISRRYWVGSLWERIISVVRPFRQLLRLGIHHLWPLPDGGYLVVIRKRVLRVSKDGAAEEVLRFPRGNKPAHKGVCVTPDGAAYLAEYALNFDRKLPVVLYRSRNGCQSFEAIYTFSPGQVRHIHFIQWDPYEKCLWMGTGDADTECLLFCSRDGGDSWEKIGGGAQFWRAVGIVFRPEALYWGTDAGSDAGSHPNYVMRWTRATGQLEKLIEVQGPCHGAAALADGRLLVSTGVEGGENEKDACAHLWAAGKNCGWQEVASFRKDSWPLIAQYGVLRFPCGLESGSNVMFTSMGVVGGGEAVFVGSILE